MVFPEQKTYFGTKPISILTFIKNILEMRKRCNTNRYYGATTNNNMSPTPSKVNEKGEEDKKEVELISQNQNCKDNVFDNKYDNNGSLNDFYNMSSGAEDFMVPPEDNMDEEQ